MLHLVEAGGEEDDFRNVKIIISLVSLSAKVAKVSLYIRVTWHHPSFLLRYFMVVNVGHWTINQIHNCVKTLSYSQQWSFYFKNLSYCLDGRTGVKGPMNKHLFQRSCIFFCRSHFEKGIAPETRLARPCPCSLPGKCQASCSIVQVNI